MTSKKPILITGSHRSGSTWVGKMLGASPDLVYIDEPFHPYHHSFFQREVFEYWFTYITQENEAQYFSYLNKTIHSTFDFVFDARTVKTRKDQSKFVQNYWASLKKRLRGARPLMKDPIAVFSASGCLCL
jgi:LPS sulfotransferase NodH